MIIAQSTDAAVFCMVPWSTAFHCHLQIYDNVQPFDGLSTRGVYCSCGSETEVPAAVFADPINDSSNASEIVIAWNALAKESMQSLRELVSNIANSWRKFEKNGMVMPTATKMLRLGQFTIPGVCNTSTS